MPIPINSCVNSCNNKNIVPVNVVCRTPLQYSSDSVNISGQTVNISGQTVVVDISGQVVDISGQTVVVDISGQVVDISGQVVVVDISGQTVVVDISGQTVDISGQTVDISGQVVDISGQVVDITGQNIIADISGATFTDGKLEVDISRQVVDISGATFTDGKLEVDISGQVVDISGANFTAAGKLEVDISGQVVDISGQTIKIDSTPSNPVNVSLGPVVTSAFGDISITEVTPVVQLEAIYGINGEINEYFQTYNGNSGSAGVIPNDGDLFYADSSNNAGGYGVIRSKRFLRYRPGQGGLSRFTAMFTQGIAGTEQRAGVFNQESAFMFGYHDASFGILHSLNAKAHIEQFTVNTSANSANSITITLNGVDNVVQVSTGLDTIQNAGQINYAKTVSSDPSFNGWLVEQCDNKVFFLSESVGPLTGDFSFNDTGGTGLTGTLETLQSGVAATDNWIYQSGWNVDKLDGTGASGMTLDPTKLNVYQIRYKWLGSGSIAFYIESNITGEFILVHIIQRANQFQEVSIQNPSLKCGYVAYNTANPGDTGVIVKGASMMMGIEGQIKFNTYSRSCFYNATIPNDFSLHIMSIQNRITYNNKINTKELIMTNISLGLGEPNSNGGDSQPVDVYFLLNGVQSNPGLTDNYNFTSIQGTPVCVSTNSSIEYTINNTTDYQNIPILTKYITKQSSTNINLIDNRIIISPGDILTIYAFNPNTKSFPIHAALTWIID